ncbi:MAG TPA: mechanosensitive ion channel domain-containing protein [Pseudolabrys sp.]|jgi:small-conductance mechanosensitive channel|nr:mechanosensitive ion channel domain-containing protein [Pseudolabrys sp.]
MNGQEIIQTVENAFVTVAHEAVSVWVLAQMGVILIAAAAASIVTTMLRRHTDVTAHTQGWPPLMRLWVQLCMANLGLVIFTLLLVVMRPAFGGIANPEHVVLLDVVATLAIAWVVIALAAAPIANRFVYRLVTGFTWLLVAGYVVGVRQTIRAALDSFGVMIGGVRVTPLLLIKATVLLLLALWAANAVGNFLEKRVRRVTDLTPSIQVLLIKLIRLGLITFAALIVLSSVGIDFTSLAFFSGAIGVGVGFGLQKIVSNLVSGIILLADKSIKPGDVITVGDNFGWVASMGARYTSVVTLDGREFLVPNEDFVTQRVINWSYSNAEVRLDVDFGVSYSADPHKVIALALEAIKSVERVLEKPKPVCNFRAFGDSSINFTLAFWIRDPKEGTINVRSHALLALWDALKREKIEIPFPQRDINPRGPFRVVVEREGGDGSPS